MQPAQPQNSSPAQLAPGISSAVPHSAGQAAALSVNDRLVRSRLGVFAGLYYALRAKHPPTAAHGLRVALACSKWAQWCKLPHHERHILEVAALLHDIGKIGLPDRVLQKPSGLDGKEQLMMEMHYHVSAEMLRGAGGSEELIEVVQQSRVHFSQAKNQPRVSRMLAIVDAFDSMTAEQVFRQAVSRERATRELFAYAGTQFDPELVKQFAELISQPRPELESSMANRWLNQLIPSPTPGFWESDVSSTCGVMQNLVDTLFHRRLLDSLSDGVIYLDVDGQILHWNHAAEKLTGRQATSLMHRRWSAELMGLVSSDSGEALAPEQCPLDAVLADHNQVDFRLQLKHSDGRSFQVNFSALPVFSEQKEFAGVILLVRDASAQVNLEERVQSLHEIATRDSLTKVANRAELNRRLPEFLKEYVELGHVGSLIICDIDHFKRINDTHGHQAGDDALVTFAGILSEVARRGDLVARYGGEEFVILCAGCDNSAATIRAEEMRRAVERTPVPALRGNTMTASFGVTEIQRDDTEETFVARADRALLTAKESGRNRVVQLGSCQDSDQQEQTQDCLEEEQQRSSWLSWFQATKEVPVVEAELLASVPHAIAVQKLKGFINDHHADVLKIDESHVSLRIDGQRGEGVRRKGERPTVMLMEVGIHPVDYRSPRSTTYQSKTKFHVSIRPVKARDRRAEALQGQAGQLLASFNSYLVAQEITDEIRESIIEPR